MTYIYDRKCKAVRNFNPHPYVRDDPELADEEELPFYFNPHPYVRDDRD